MSQIKGKNTKPEERVRRYLFAHGYRYRKNVSTLPGKPDIVLPKYRTCIFVNGCFWHRHEGCKYFVWPKNNADFWRNKINGNVERDTKEQQALTAMGWNVLIVWECELKGKEFDGTMERLMAAIQKQEEIDYGQRRKTSPILPGENLI